MADIDRQNVRITAHAGEPKRLLLGDAMALSVLLGWTPPDVANTSTSTAAGRCLWLGPKQWLLLGTATMAQSGRAVIADAGARWSRLAIDGMHAADLLAQGCSLDLREAKFGLGGCAQTRIEQVPVILERTAANEFQVLVERPLAHHLELWLREAARDFL